MSKIKEIRELLEKALRQMKSNFVWDSKISGLYTMVNEVLSLLPKDEPCQPEQSKLEPDLKEK